MANFTYTARDDAGHVSTGTITAENPTEAARAIRREGKFVVRLDSGMAAARASAPKSAASGAKAVSLTAPTSSTAVSPAATPAPAGSSKDKYKPDDLVHFTNQLAVMLDTGVSLAEGLEACTNESNSPAFAKALAAVIDEVTGGKEFSGALAQHPRIFPVVYVNLIKASEATGAMGPMLTRLANLLDHQRELSRKIKGAIAYPIFMMVFALGVTGFLLAFVLPRFATIYAGKEDKLPAITRYLMAFSNFLVDYGLYALGALVVGGIASFFYLRTAAGGMAVERARFAIPLVGPLFHKTCLARSLRTLGTMIQSGVGMLDALGLTAGSSGSRNYHALWTAMQSRVETGQQLSDALADRPEFPKPVLKMIAAGERTGRLGGVLENVAHHCEQELNGAIKALTSLLEPAIVIFLGTVVGGLVLALLLPIFTISKAMH